MVLSVIDHPRKVDRETYVREIDCMVSRLSATGFVQSIYQIGSINHPGISDIDLLVVIDSDIASTFNPRAHLDAEGRYVFTHSLFAVPSHFMAEYSRFTLYHNHQCLWGHGVELGQGNPDEVELQQLKRQIALEFLAKNYIDLCIQFRYRMLKLRVVLQHLKGLRFDLDFLNITDGDMYDLLSESMNHINHWFENRNTSEFDRVVIHQVAATLEKLLAEVLDNRPMVSPSNQPFQFAANVLVQPAQSLGCSHRGIVLPRSLALLGRKYFNLQHRLNSFVFSIPMQSGTHDTYISERFAFLSRIKRHIHDNLPHFAAPLPPFFYNAI